MHSIALRCGLFLTLMLFSWLATAENTLYFYNPESNINDFRSLKSLFDSYLSDNGAYRFQPFDKKGYFENFLKKQKNDVFLLSSWHYQELLAQNHVGLKLVLIGTINGNITYTKVLSTKKNIGDISGLDGKRIASAGNKGYTKNILESIAMQQQVHTRHNILSVPKDIDALMSVLFGMSQGALTARNSLNALANINQKKYRLLHQLAESQAIMLPLVLAYEPINASTQKLLDAIKNMPDSATGKGILGMLGWDGWKEAAQAEIRFLTQRK
ncbi:MAG: phosphate/phosphite/phosphonate ABC transporter substrate-binding protein [Gammaproteobacteria bacterium]|nr:phosphate/phosphite/phosphonate ABC transporter substrate-binding protein [Gammaproteobacteria bacterium]